HNLKHNKVLHERNVILTIDTAEVPHVAESERIEVINLREGFYRIILHYGFMEEPNLMETLKGIKVAGQEFKVMDTTFFLGRETLITSERRGMAMWRERLFVGMSRNARSATDFFGLPPNRVVELGTQIEI